MRILVLNGSSWERALSWCHDKSGNTIVLDHWGGVYSVHEIVDIITKLRALVRL